MATISLSWGKDGLEPHGFPMYNLKATCYGIKLWILTLDDNLGCENHLWYTKPSNMTSNLTHAKYFLCMAYVVD